MININAHYHLDRVDCPETLYKASDVFVDSLSHYFLNDNQVIRIIFDVAGESGCIANDLDFSAAPDAPREVTEVLAALHKEYPDVNAFTNDANAFEFVRSRYTQFGGELSEYAHYLSTILKDSLSKIPDKPEPTEPPKTE